MGEWTTFTPTRAAAAGTWTGGTVPTAAYMLVGKTLFIDLNVDASSNSNVTGTVSITIPGGFTAAAQSAAPVALYDLGVEIADGVFLALAGATTVAFHRANGANISINVATLYVHAQFCLEVQ